MLGRVGRFFVELGWPIGISVAALLLWELAVRELDIRSIILPPPSEVFVAMFQRSELLLTNLWPSLYLTVVGFAKATNSSRSEEHTSELQSHLNLVCRLLLEKKKKK